MRILSLYLQKTDSMPRPKRLRKVVAPPSFKGFKPYGNIKSNKKACELFYEEYEAIKLADYDGLNQKEAAEIMGVSRPTFARIYLDARKKIAKALVETREIITIYGHALFDKNWFQCNKCHSKFNMLNESDKKNCPLCDSRDFYSIQSHK